MVTLYGIKNCDTVKKARRWLEQKGIDYCFHDFRSDGLDAQQVQSWMDAVGWEKLLNKRSSSWRNLADETKNGLCEKNLMGLLLEQPTLIKRPVLEQKNHIHLGFKEADYQQIFS